MLLLAVVPLWRAANSAERDELLANLEEGSSLKGVVKNLTDYGAFVDLGGIDGLLHITDMSWKRIKHPSEMINVGDEIDVKVLKFDRERNRVSLGMKQMGEDPWGDIKGATQKAHSQRLRLLTLPIMVVLLKLKMVLKVWCTFLKWIGLTKTFTHLRLLILVKKLKLWSWISTKNVVVSHSVSSSASPTLGTTLLRL